MNLIFRIDEELELRLWEPRHAEELFAVIDANREHIGRWLPWCTPQYAIDDARTFIRQNLESLAAGKGATFGVYERGRLVGGAGNGGVNLPNKSCDIGYWLAADAQGRGIMTRAARAATDYALIDMGLNRCTIHAAVENKRSWSVPKRLGYEFVATMRKAVPLHEKFIDSVQYAMLAEDWITVRDLQPAGVP